MDEQQAMQIARKWLLEQGYTQFNDGCWSWKGEEADAEAVLAEYILEQYLWAVVRNG